jgi:hypothetical protein
MGIAFRFVLGFLVYSGWAYMQTDGVSCTVQATWDSDTHRVTGLVCILRVVAAHSLRIITFFGTQNSALIPTSPCCCSVRLEPPWSLSTSEKKAEACDGLSRLLPTFIEIPHRSMERHVTLRRRFLSYPSSSYVLEINPIHGWCLPIQGSCRVPLLSSSRSPSSTTGGLVSRLPTASSVPLQPRHGISSPLA